MGSRIFEGGDYFKGNYFEKSPHGERWGGGGWGAVGGDSRHGYCHVIIFPYLSHNISAGNATPLLT